MCIIWQSNPLQKVVLTDYMKVFHALAPLAKHCSYFQKQNLFCLYVLSSLVGTMIHGTMKEQGSEFSAYPINMLHTVFPEPKLTLLSPTLYFCLQTKWKLSFQASDSISMATFVNCFNKMLKWLIVPWPPSGFKMHIKLIHCQTQNWNFKRLILPQDRL